MKRNLVKTSFFVTILLCVGYVVSFIKESTIANYFGAGAAVDAYTIAIQIPVAIFALVSVSLRTVIIPYYTELIQNRSTDEANGYINVLLSTTGLFVIGLIIIISIFAKYIVMGFAPGFSVETNALATSMLRILAPTMLVSLIIDIATAVLNVHKQFVLPSLAVLLLNTTLIIAVVILHSKLGIVSAAIGQFIGCLMEVIFFYFLIRKYINVKLILDWKHEYLHKSVKMAFPVIWSTCLSEFNGMINRMVASFLFVGSIAMLSYASKVNSIFISFFTSAIATIIYPLYAQSAANNDIKSLCSHVNKTLSVYALFLIPITCIVWCLKKEIIIMAFARGKFGIEAVEGTQMLLGWYSISLVFMGFRETLTKVFFSMKDSKTIAINTTVGLILNIILNLTLPWFLGIKGLAIATTISTIFISVSLMVRMLKKYSGINILDLKDNILRIIPSSFIALTVTIFLKNILVDLNVWLLSLISTVVYVIAYILSLILFRPHILILLLNKLLGKDDLVKE